MLCVIVRRQCENISQMAKPIETNTLQIYIIIRRLAHGSLVIFGVHQNERIRLMCWLLYPLSCRFVSFISQPALTPGFADELSLLFYKHSAWLCDDAVVVAFDTNLHNSR